uniref:Uncharacterized protein n=1 Tax=Octopus bimaculoides TaxID=37653 RepID=A0A0L8GYB9_OCTBM
MWNSSIGSWETGEEVLAQTISVCSLWEQEVGHQTETREAFGKVIRMEILSDKWSFAKLGIF